MMVSRQAERLKATPSILRRRDNVSLREELRGLDFSLLPKRTVRVRGRVFSAASGRPGRGASLWLYARESGARGSVFRMQTVVEDSQGAFEFRGVTPGSYVLGANGLEEGEIYAARQTLDISDADVVDGISLVLAAGIELKGRVRTEGNAQLNSTSIRSISSRRAAVRRHSAAEPP